jgi:hypothetical protein
VQSAALANATSAGWDRSEGEPDNVQKDLKAQGGHGRRIRKGLKNILILNLVLPAVIQNLLIPLVALVPPVLHNLDLPLAAQGMQHTDVISVADADQPNFTFILEGNQSSPRLQRMFKSSKW